MRQGRATCIHYNHVNLEAQNLAQSMIPCFFLALVYSSTRHVATTPRLYHRIESRCSFFSATR
jgi:hypothetical protein